MGQVPAPEPEEEAQPTPAPEPEEECTVDEDCADGLLCADGKCTEPSPDAELVLPFILADFQDNYNAAFDSGDPVALGRIFHDAVNDLYGPDQCQAYADSVIETHVNIRILNWTGPEAWTWLIDGRSILIDDAYTVQVDFTRDTTITSQPEFHPAVRADGSLGLLTDCGDPLPLPVEPECSSDQDCPEGSRCNADGECDAEQQQTPTQVSITGINPPGLFGWPEAYAMPGSMPTGDDCGLPPEETVPHVCARGQEWGSTPVDAQGNFVLTFPWPGVSTGWVWGGLTLWDGDHQVRGFIGAPIDFEPDGKVEDGVLYLHVGELRIIFECPHP